VAAKAPKRRKDDIRENRPRTTDHGRSIKRLKAGGKKSEKLKAEISLSANCANDTNQKQMLKAKCQMLKLAFISAD
jgi:hypothetical protein